jgi:hypothetical protein
MSQGKSTPGGEGARQVNYDASAFLDAPIELLREQALARGKRGSPACTLIAKMFRIVAIELVFGGHQPTNPARKGRGHLPPGFSMGEAAQRATDLLDLADDLDGLGRP